MEIDVAVWAPLTTTWTLAKPTALFPAFPSNTLSSEISLAYVCFQYPFAFVLFIVFFTEMLLIRRAKNWTLLELSSLTQNMRRQVEDRAQIRLANSWTYSMPLGVQPFCISLIDNWVIVISSSTPEPSHTPESPLSLDLIRSGRLPQSKQWEILLLKGSVKALLWHLWGQTLLPVASSIGAHKH